MHWLIVILALLAAVPAAPATAACNSIADEERSDCPPPPRVTYGPDLRVEIVARKRQLTFPLSAELKDDPTFDTACPRGKCACAELVERLDFKGPVPGFRQVNEAEWRASAAMKCSVENSSVSRQVLRFAVTKNFISTAVRELEYCHGCGGSCHGNGKLSAYDARSGGIVKLADAVDAGKLSDLKTRLIENFVAAHVDEAREATAKLVREDLDRSNFLEKGLYVEPSRVFVDLDTFALGCADGSFHPVEIPPEFLTPAFRARL